MLRRKSHPFGLAFRSNNIDIEKVLGKEKKPLQVDCRNENELFVRWGNLMVLKVNDVFFSSVKTPVGIQSLLFLKCDS